MSEQWMESKLAVPAVASMFSYLEDAVLFRNLCRTQDIERKKDHRESRILSLKTGRFHAYLVKSQVQTVQHFRYFQGGDFS